MGMLLNRPFLKLPDSIKPLRDDGGPLTVIELGAQALIYGLLIDGDVCQC